MEFCSYMGFNFCQSLVLMKTSRRENYLLLTSTISPMSGLPSFARTDAATRLLDYSTALREYLRLVISGQVDRVIFVENSGSDLSRLVAIVAEMRLSERVSFISFSGLDFPVEKGRGYGEFKMVDYAMRQPVLANVADDVVIWKCTGRYVFRNLGKIISTAPSKFDIYCHCRDYPFRLTELFLLAWNKVGYSSIIAGMCEKISADLMPDGVYTHEVLFRNLVDEGKKTVKVAPRFRVIPAIQGIRAYNNTRFADNAFNPKMIVRRICNVALPFLWI
jgi:hypothetical protein